jgi:hypothetical protein
VFHAGRLPLASTAFARSLWLGAVWAGVVVERLPIVALAAGSESPSEDSVRLVPIEVDGQRIYLSVRAVQPARGEPGDEREIAYRKPRLEQVLDGLAVFAQEIGGRFQETNASKVTVQFGCEVVLESGTLIAVIGKASATSTITVGLEWAKPTP